MYTTQYGIYSIGDIVRDKIYGVKWIITGFNDFFNHPITIRCIQPDQKATHSFGEVAFWRDDGDLEVIHSNKGLSTHDDSNRPSYTILNQGLNDVNLLSGAWGTTYTNTVETQMYINNNNTEPTVNRIAEDLKRLRKK